LNDVYISQQAVDEMFRDIDGPIGDLMRDIAHQIQKVAIEKAPVLKANNVRSLRSTALRTADGTVKIPGYTKRNITTTVGHSKLHDGYVFGGANAPGDPAIFLEVPAEQLHHKHPFLTTGLWSVHVE
jgi:hypothetical protein